MSGQAEWADWAKGEIDRLERILAALREPSDAVLDAAYEAYNAIIYAGSLNGGSLCPSIRAAVAAAEQEVGG